MAAQDRLSFVLDGRSVETTAGKSVLEAALDAGVYIPHLCHSPLLEGYGACRLCLVEIEGARGAVAACTTLVRDGMTVRSETDQVNSLRRATTSLIISEHVGDCLTCSANQRCELQKVARHVGISEMPARRSERQEGQIDSSNPFFELDRGKCVLCGLCVRICHEVRGRGAIDILNRGFDSVVAPFGGQTMLESVCESCGACVDVCPVGALTAKDETLPPVEEVKTICPYCGVGCILLVGTRGGRIVSVRPDESAVNRGQLCVKGRFGLEFVGAPDRLTTPLVRRNGELQPATWDEALDIVASRFSEIKAKHGAEALAGLASAKCTNEENYLFQKLVRAVFGTNNVDHCARLCHASTVAGLAQAFGSGAMTNSIDELEFADCIFVTGSNTTEAHPVIALRIKDAVTKHGAELIVADPREIDLTTFAAVHLRHRSGTDVALFNAMMHVILEEGLADEMFMRERTEGFEEFQQVVAEYAPENVEALTGVAAADIRAAARTYGRAKTAAIVYAMGITQHTTGTDNVLSLANMAMLTGNLGRPSTGVNPLRGQNNVQGACDLGALPNVLPGYQAVDDEGVRSKFEKSWGVDLPGEAGLTAVEIVHAAGEGKIRGLYVMGENPALSDPNANRTREALQATEFLVVQDAFLSETAQYADVVLPAATFAEKDGTFTNTERRVQRVRKAIQPPGEARADWEILCQVATAMGHPMHYEHPFQIQEEIASLTPIYGGISYDRIEEEGLQWPCPEREHPGTPYLHAGSFNRGLGKFHPTPFRDAVELPDKDYPFLLTTGRILQQYHTGTMTRRSEGLETLSGGPVVEVHPADAEELGLDDGQMAAVSSRRGLVNVAVRVTDRSRKGTVFMSFHFREAAANVLTNDALDPVAKIPEFKVCAVKIEPVTKRRRRKRKKAKAND